MKDTKLSKNLARLSLVLASSLQTVLVLESLVLYCHPPKESQTRSGCALRLRSVMARKSPTVAPGFGLIAKVSGSMYAKATLMLVTESARIPSRVLCEQLLDLKVLVSK
jgi:hypothetical protein